MHLSLSLSLPTDAPMSTTAQHRNEKGLREPIPKEHNLECTVTYFIPHTRAHISVCVCGSHCKRPESVVSEMNRFVAVARKLLDGDASLLQYIQINMTYITTTT